MVSSWLSVCLSVCRPSVFSLPTITWVNVNGFSPNSVCALILWISGLGLLMCKFYQFLTSCLPAIHLCFHFRMITLVNISGFSPSLVCALILWRPGLGLLMGKFHQFLTKLPACDTSVFSFLDDNFSKYQWIFTKLGMCIDIVEFWFGIANGQISSIFDRVICPQYIRILLSGQ